MRDPAVFAGLAIGLLLEAAAVAFTCGVIYVWTVILLGPM